MYVKLNVIFASLKPKRKANIEAKEKTK